jgi:hypothetical protein
MSASPSPSPSMMMSTMSSSGLYGRMATNYLSLEDAEVMEEVLRMHSSMHMSASPSPSPSMMMSSHHSH